MASPTAPIQIGVFFEYPPGSSTSGIEDYWLAAYGHKVRMTPACKTALLATFEAVLERATAPANVGSSVQSLNELSVNDLGGVEHDMTTISVAPWDTALYRSTLKNKL